MVGFWDEKLNVDQIKGSLLVRLDWSLIKHDTDMQKKIILYYVNNRDQMHKIVLLV